MKVVGKEGWSVRGQMRTSKMRTRRAQNSENLEPPRSHRESLNILRSSKAKKDSKAAAVLE